MARTTFSIDRLTPASSTERTQRQQLDAEKLGVIAGFLLGLPLGLSLVQDSLVADGLPTWLAGAAAVATVMATTWLGLKAAAVVAKLLHGQAA